MLRIFQHGGTRSDLDDLAQIHDSDAVADALITHDMGVVAEIADRVVVMWRGRKVEEGKRRASSPIRSIPTRALCSRLCRASAPCRGSRSLCAFP